MQSDFMNIREIRQLRMVVDDALAAFLEKLEKRIETLIEKKLIEQKVIFPPEDMEKAKGLLFYQSPERLFLKCMKCDDPVEAEERYVILHYSETRKLDPNIRRWSKAQGDLPHTCIGCKERIKDGDEIAVLHEICFDRIGGWKLLQEKK